jgi:hypothetical protein
VVFTPHVLPQLPQFELSLVVSMHAVTPASVGQLVRPVPHAVPHMPIEQACPAPHALPQPPQFAGSTWVSTQLMPHWVVPPPHAAAHEPAEQTCPALHTVPQAPQFCGSV